MVSPLSAAAPPLHTASSSPRPAATRSGPSAEQLAALHQLVARYATDQTQSAAASTLSGLSRQIMAMAKSLNQQVTLPRASAAAAPQSGKINVTA